MLTEQKKLFVLELIKLKCKNATQAAINAGYSEKSASQQASRLVKDSEVTEFLNEKKSELESELREQFVFEAKEAFSVMQSIMNNPKSSDKDRISIAKDFLDRAGYKPVEKQDVSGNLGINLILDEVGDG